jgi:hypothetical protein
MFAQSSFAQNYGFSIYSENGEKFDLFTNYKRKTPQAANEVTVLGFRKNIVSARIDFERNTMPEINQQIIMRDGFISRYRIVNRGRKNAELVFEGYENLPQYDDDNTTTIVSIEKERPLVDDYDKHNYRDYEPYKQHPKNAYNQPVDNAGFALIMKNLQGLSFDTEKISRAKQIVESNILTSTQVKEMLTTFDFDSRRLEFAKYAYNYVYDKNMYFIVNESFDFSSNGKQLDEYIASIR